MESGKVDGRVPVINDTIRSGREDSISIIVQIVQVVHVRGISLKRRL